jgi:endonuclease/exonuclease/phosphatase family metal-dependent hydrolase
MYNLLIVNNSDYRIGGNYSYNNSKQVPINLELNPKDFFSLEISANKCTFSLNIKENNFANNESLTEFVLSTQSKVRHFTFTDKISPFLKFQVHMGKGKPNVSPEWGNVLTPNLNLNYLKEDFGILITINETIKESLSILTYNTHLFNKSVIPFGKFWERINIKEIWKIWKVKNLKKIVSLQKLYNQSVKECVVFDDERKNKLIEKIYEQNVDIIFLQEVWAVEMQNSIISDLKALYPFIHTLSDVNKNLPWTKIFSKIGWLFTSTSGIVVASRFPLLEAFQNLYNDMKGPDSFSQKSFLLFNIITPVSKILCTKITFATTHAPCYGERQFCSIVDMASAAFRYQTELEKQKQIKIENQIIKEIEEETDRRLEKIKDKRKKGKIKSILLRDEIEKLKEIESGQNEIEYDCILAGDFNIQRETKDHYDRLKSFMDIKHSIDLVDKKLSNIIDSYTTWDFGNKFALELNKRAGKIDIYDKKDRIDYVYLRNGKESYFSDYEVTVFHDWNIKIETEVYDTSDHYPIRVDFIINIQQ